MTEAEKIKQLYNQLISSPLHTFPTEGKVNVSERHGVYIVYGKTPDKDVLHVGMTPYGKGGINQRLYNHVSKTGVFYREYLMKKDISLRDGYKFRYLIIDDPRARALLEALTAGLLCPAHIGTGVRRKIV